MPSVAEPKSPQATQGIGIRNDGSITVINIHPQVLDALPTQPDHPAQTNDEPRKEPEIDRPLVATSVYIDKQLKADILKQLPRDKSFGKLYQKMLDRYKKSPKDERVTTFKSFRLDSQSRLLFFQTAEGSKRICIPDKFM
jgi:hypothetical protein